MISIEQLLENLYGHHGSEWPRISKDRIVKRLIFQLGKCPDCHSDYWINDAYFNRSSYRCMECNFEVPTDMHQEEKKFWKEVCNFEN